MWYTLDMKKKATKTVKKSAVRTTRKRSTKKTVKKKRSIKKRLGPYTYDTEIGVFMRDHDFVLEGVSPKMKLGDFFKSRKSGKPFLKMLDPQKYV